MSNATRRQPRLFDNPVYGEGAQIIDFEDLDLHETWEDRMQSGNDLIVAIAASSRTEMSGTGKTTLATQLCRRFDDTASGFSAEEKATLSSDAVANSLYPGVEERSAILFDEAQGTASSDGVDTRRAMADEVLKMSRAAATYRWKQISMVIVSQSTRWIDSRMMDLLDRLILIQEKNHDEGWARGVIFDHYFRDLPGDKQERTPAVEDIYWYPLPEDDPDYQTLHEMKAAAGNANNSGDGGDSEEKIPQSKQLEIAEYLHDDGHSWMDIAAKPFMDFSREFYRKEVKGLEEDDA